LVAWGTVDLRGPLRFPAFDLDLLDGDSFEGPGNLSITHYRFRLSDGASTVEWTTSNRSGIEQLRFGGRAYFVQVFENDDGPTQVLVEPVQP
jgi:hypothetical protein